MQSREQGAHYYFFVDEAGDLTLQGRRGKPLLGADGVPRCEGVSRYFMVGMALIRQPETVRKGLSSLRAELLADPYLKGVPSMQPSEEKTARCFHAKDDCAEVRMRVFQYLKSQDIEVQVGVKRKAEVLKTALSAKKNGVKWDANTIYDNVVKTLFKRKLHIADKNTICFARRGNSTREMAFQSAIDQAKSNFSRDTGKLSNVPTSVVPSVPSSEPGLQAVDYFLWALQRMYERREDRFFNYVREHYRMIMDFDDPRAEKSYGMWYNDKNPLTLEKIKPVTG